MAYTPPFCHGSYLTSDIAVYIAEMTSSLREGQNRWSAFALAKIGVPVMLLLILSGVWSPSGLLQYLQRPRSMMQNLPGVSNFTITLAGLRSLQTSDRQWNIWRVLTRPQRTKAAALPLTGLPCTSYSREASQRSISRYKLDYSCSKLQALGTTSLPARVCNMLYQCFSKRLELGYFATLSALRALLLRFSTLKTVPNEPCPICSMTLNLLQSTWPADGAGWTQELLLTLQSLVQQFMELNNFNLPHQRLFRLRLARRVWSCFSRSRCLCSFRFITPRNPSHFSFLAMHFWIWACISFRLRSQSPVGLSTSRSHSAGLRKVYRTYSASNSSSSDDRSGQVLSSLSSCEILASSFSIFSLRCSTLKFSWLLVSTCSTNFLKEGELSRLSSPNTPNFSLSIRQDRFSYRLSGYLFSLSPSCSLGCSGSALLSSSRPRMRLRSCSKASSTELPRAATLCSNWLCPLRVWLRREEQPISACLLRLMFSRTLRLVLPNRYISPCRNLISSFSTRIMALKLLDSITSGLMLSSLLFTLSLHTFIRVSSRSCSTRLYAQSSIIPAFRCSPSFIRLRISSISLFNFRSFSSLYSIIFSLFNFCASRLFSAHSQLNVCFRLSLLFSIFSILEAFSPACFLSPDSSGRELSFGSAVFTNLSELIELSFSFRTQVRQKDKYVFSCEGFCLLASAGQPFFSLKILDSCRQSLGLQRACFLLSGVKRVTVANSGREGGGLGTNPSSSRMVMTLDSRTYCFLSFAARAKERAWKVRVVSCSTDMYQVGLVEHFFILSEQLQRRLMQTQGNCIQIQRLQQQLLTCSWRRRLLSLTNCCRSLMSQSSRVPLRPSSCTSSRICSSQQRLNLSRFSFISMLDSLIFCGRTGFLRRTFSWSSRFRARLVLSSGSILPDSIWRTRACTRCSTGLMSGWSRGSGSSHMRQASSSSKMRISERSREMPLTGGCLQKRVWQVSKSLNSFMKRLTCTMMRNRSQEEGWQCMRNPSTALLYSITGSKLFFSSYSQYRHSANLFTGLNSSSRFYTSLTTSFSLNHLQDRHSWCVCSSSLRTEFGVLFSTSAILTRTSRMRAGDTTQAMSWPRYSWVASHSPLCSMRRQESTAWKSAKSSLVILVMSRIYWRVSPFCAQTIAQRMLMNFSLKSDSSFPSSFITFFMKSTRLSHSQKDSMLTRSSRFTSCGLAPFPSSGTSMSSTLHTSAVLRLNFVRSTYFRRKPPTRVFVCADTGVFRASLESMMRKRAEG